MKPVHKNTVKALLRRGETFKGYIAPCNVNSFHVAGGWHIGMAVEFTSIEQMEFVADQFAHYNCGPELGYRVRFWTV